MRKKAFNNSFCKKTKKQRLLRNVWYSTFIDNFVILKMVSFMASK